MQEIELNFERPCPQPRSFQNTTEFQIEREEVDEHGSRQITQKRNGSFSQLLKKNHRPFI